MEQINFVFNDVDWGADEAKHDPQLAEYFITFPEYNELLCGDKRYIIGRKGTGKTAVLEKIRIDCDSDSKMFYSNVSLKNFPLNDFRSFGNKKYQNKSKYVDIWKFLLLVEFAKLIVSDCSMDTEPVSLLTEFLESNFPSDMGMTTAIEVLVQKKGKVSIPDFLTVEGGKDTKAYVEIYFDKMVEKLEKIILNCNLSSKLYILIDELDEGYKNSVYDSNLVLLSLLRACEDLSLAFRHEEIPAFTVLALRADIFKSLEDNDLNKLDDFIFELNWETGKDSVLSLFRLVEQRIAVSFCKKYPNKNLPEGAYWPLISSSDDDDKDLWKYLCGMTFDRPRDIVKILKCCKKAITQPKLSLQAFRNAETQYSKWFYNEFKDEAQSFISCWREVLGVLTEVGEGKAEIVKLEQTLLRHPTINLWLNEKHQPPSYILDTLFNYSVIGCVNDFGRWLFKYKDEDLERIPSDKYYCIHYGFISKLRIKRKVHYSEYLRLIENN